MTGTLKFRTPEGWTEFKGAKGDPGEVTNAALESRVAPIEDATNAVVGDVATLQLGQTLTNLRTQGLSLDGTTDETAAFQAVLDNASDGDVLVLDERAKLNISDTVSMSGKRVEVRGYGDAEIHLTSIIETPIVDISHAANGAFRNVRITGAETSFVDAIGSSRIGLNVANSPDFTIEGVSLSNVSRGIYVASCPRVVVDGVFFQGMAPGHSSNINFHSTLVISQSDYAKVSRVHGQDCGSAMVVGSGSSHGTAHQISGYNTYDNGIYISSGTNWEVVSPVFRMDPNYTGTVGTGVKMRGSFHTLLGGHFEYMGISAGMSGIGADAGDGTNGQGSRIIGATSLYARWMGYGITPYQEASYKDGVIAFCTDIGSGVNADAATMGSFRILAGFGHTIAYNTSRDNKVHDAAFLIGGSGSYPVSRLSFVGNTVRSPQKWGVVVKGVTNSTFDGTRIESIPGSVGLYLQDAANNNFITNTRTFGSTGTLATIRLNAGCTGNRVMNNPTATVSDAGSGNLLSGNDGSVSANIAASGSWGGNAAGKSLAQALHALGIIRDVTTA